MRPSESCVETEAKAGEMKRLAMALLLTAGVADAAHAADLSSAKASEPPKARNCFSSVWDWLNASVSDCPLSYAGFTLYGTIDVGYGYDTAGVSFREVVRQGGLLHHPENQRRRALVLVSQRLERFNGWRENGGADRRRLAADRRGRAGL